MFNAIVLTVARCELPEQTGSKETNSRAQSTYMIQCMIALTTLRDIAEKSLN